MPRTIQNGMYSQAPKAWRFETFCNMNTEARPSPKKQFILEAAQVLFAQRGYHAVGVDRISESAGVTKMTLYKHFQGKDDLIERVLQSRDEYFRVSLLKAIEPHDAPMDKLKAIFEWHRQWFAQVEFNGCMFIKAVEEFPLQYGNIRRLSCEHKRWIQGLLRSIVDDLQHPDPEAMSVHLLIILDGLIVNANFFRFPGVVDSTWAMVSELLKSGSTGR